jgi:SAM-dependent methyltransferase
MLPEEVKLLESVTSPVLDVGCGPGRHSATLARAGHNALGIDTSAAAVRRARERGAKALQVSVFGPVPNAGRWATVLLLDGNIGIGGNPVRLLQRVLQLSAPGGRVLVEVDPPGSESRRFHARVQHAGGVGPGFPWACVGAGGIRRIADSAGLRTIEVMRGGERWFAELEKPLN